MNHLNDEVRQYAAMGMAAQIPGIQVAIDHLQQMLDQMRSQLAQLQQGEQQPARRASRLANRPFGKGPGTTGWSEDPEERKREMERRMKARRAKTPIPITDRNHPDHVKWVAKVTKQRRKKWASLTVREQKERLAKMAAGKVKAQASRALEATA